MTSLPDSLGELQHLDTLLLWDVPLQTLPNSLAKMTLLQTIGTKLRVIPAVVFNCKNYSRFNIFDGDCMATGPDALKDLNLTPVSTRNKLAFYTRNTHTHGTLKQLAANVVFKLRIPTAGLPQDIIDFLRHCPTAVCATCNAEVRSWIEVRQSRISNLQYSQAYAFEDANITQVFRGCSRTPGWTQQKTGTVPVQYAFCSNACLDAAPKPPKRAFSQGGY